MAGRAAGRSAWGETVGFHGTQRGLWDEQEGGLARGARFQAINKECQVREEMQFALNTGCSGRGGCRCDSPPPCSQGVQGLKGRSREQQTRLGPR